VRLDDPGRPAISLFLKRFQLLPDRPHVRVPMERGNFSCHASRFLVYSRCSSHIHSTLTNVALPWHKRQRGGGAAMTFEEILDEVIAMLQRRGRVTYRTLKRQFNLDDDAFEDLKDELLYAHAHVVDDDGRGLVWTGEARPTPTLGSPPAKDQARAPLSYTPPYLAEKILTSKSVLEGERKQVTVLFADLKASLGLLADRDPEDARAILDPVLERMMAAVHR
jgi:hypothetical protein